VLQVTRIMHFCFMLYEYQLYKIYRTISDRVMPDKIMWYFTVTCVRYVLRIVESESIFKARQHHDFKTTTSWKQAETEGSMGKCGRSKDEMSEARLVRVCDANSPSAQRGRVLYDYLRIISFVL